MSISDKFVQDADWKALVICKQQFTPTKEWTDKAVDLLRDKIDSNAYAILLYDALTHEIIKIEERIKEEEAKANKEIRDAFRNKIS